MSGGDQVCAWVCVGVMGSFLFSSRRRHTRGALVTGVQTCALPIYGVLAVLAPVAGRSIDPAAICAWLEPRLPRFMIPRYIRVVDELPKTPTAKVEKHALRAHGLTGRCWDREQQSEGKQ